MMQASVEQGLHPYNLCFVHDASTDIITQLEQMARVWGLLQTQISALCNNTIFEEIVSAATNVS